MAVLSWDLGQCTEPVSRPSACSSAKYVTPASTTGSRDREGGPGTRSEPSLRLVLPVSPKLPGPAGEAEAGSASGSGQLDGLQLLSEAESRGPVTHQTGWLDDKASRALGEPGSDAAVAAAHLTPPGTG